MELQNLAWACVAIAGSVSPASRAMLREAVQRCVPEIDLVRDLMNGAEGSRYDVRAIEDAMVTLRAALCFALVPSRLN